MIERVTTPDVALEPIKGKRIILIGMRGSGKSTVGPRLAEKLKMEPVEIDKEIETAMGMPISEVVQKLGWDAFRKEESRMIKEVVKRENVVISTGGGAVLLEENIRELKQAGVCIWLNARAKVLRERMGDALNRPALTEGKTAAQEIPSVLKKRKPLYKKTADITIQTAKKSVEQVVDEILQKLQEQHIQ